MVGCCVIFFVFFCQPGFQLSLPLLFWFKVENLAVVFTHLKGGEEEKQRKSNCWNWWKARQGKRKPLEDQHTSSPIWNGVSAFSTSFLPATKFSWRTLNDETPLSSTWVFQRKVLYSLVVKKDRSPREYLALASFCSCRHNFSSFTHLCCILRFGGGTSGWSRTPVG